MALKRSSVRFRLAPPPLRATVSTVIYGENDRRFADRRILTNDEE